MAVQPSRHDPQYDLAFSVNPLTPTIGAIIEGIDLRQELGDGEIDALRSALLDWKVIFFRDQDITRDQHIAFARRFGDLEIHPATPADQPDPEVLHIVHDEMSRGRENTWHSDVTWRPEPSLGSILRAVEVPAVGGDTLFCDMYAAYEGLSDKMKDFICGLDAEHSFIRVFGKRLAANDPEKAKRLAAENPVQIHPVVRTHPETGRRGLYVNVAFVERIVGLSEIESRDLLDHLYAQARIPEYQCRFRWEKNSIAFWDNRACQHYAASDYFPQRRAMERVTICGDRPFFKP